LSGFTEEGTNKFKVFGVTYIHLGIISYLGGAAIGATGEDIVRQSNRGVVVVVIQYRLGVFGKSLLLYFPNTI
jgi:carboxylesterase type B